MDHAQSWKPRLLKNEALLKQYVMKSTQKKSTNSLFKKLGLGGIGLCALMCSLPVIGAAFGMGALTAAAALFEKASIAILALSAGLLGYWLFKRKKSSEANAPSCETDCGCKVEATPAQER